MSDYHVAATGDYIAKLERENREFRARIAEVEGARAKAMEAVKQLAPYVPATNDANARLISVSDALRDLDRSHAQAEPQDRGGGVAGDKCCAGNECGRIGCPNCQD